MVLHLSEIFDMTLKLDLLIQLKSTSSKRQRDKEPVRRMRLGIQNE